MSLFRTLRPPFSPRQLAKKFSNFAWLEPSLSAMFQDAAGTTPVTATGQVVGRVNGLDGLGHYVSQSTTANKPTYQISPQGEPVLQHDLTDVLTLTAASSLGAAASVYWANQWGVQQAHGVNVGSSYNLPGVPTANSDYVYGYIITPARPDAVTEGRIVKYLEKQAVVRRRNWFLYTASLSNAYWAASSGVTVSADATTDPFGGSGAWKITEAATTGTHRLAANSNAGFMPINKTWTITAWMKYGSTQYSGLWLSESAGGSARAVFDLVNGVVGDIGSAAQWAGLSSSIVAYPNGWYLCSLTATQVGGGGPSYAYIGCGYSSNNYAAITYAGNTNNYVLLFGPSIFSEPEPDKSYQRIDAGPGVP